jgi:hypothetical protein
MTENLNFKLRWVDHDDKLFDKDGLNLCILRNPYQTVASSIEIELVSMNKNYQDIALKHIDFFINKTMEGHIDTYNKFLYNSQNFDYINSVDFEFLIKEPDQFLNDVSKKFDIPFRKDRLSVEEVKDMMRNGIGLENRLPRKNSELRKQIDAAVNNNVRLNNCYNEYMEYKNSFDFKHVGNGH